MPEGVGAADGQPLESTGGLAGEISGCFSESESQYSVPWRCPQTPVLGITYSFHI